MPTVSEKKHSRASVDVMARKKRGSAPARMPLLRESPNSAVVEWGSLDVLPRSALVIVDVQNGFIGPATSHVPDAIRNLLDAKRNEFALVIATRFHNLPDSPFRKWIHWNRLAETPETDLVQGIGERADVVIDKNTYGIVKNLAELIGKAGVEHVYICGIDTDVCVLQNAGGLFDLGYRVFVLLNATGTNGGTDAQIAAEKLLRRTIGSDQVIAI